MAPRQPTDSAATEQTPAQEHAQRISDNAEAIIGSPEDDLGRGTETVPPKQDQEDGELDSGIVRREPIQRSPSDDIRGQISARFRRAEPEDERPFNGDMNDPENIYGEVAQDDEELTDEEIDARAAAKEKPAPKDGDVDQGDPARMITRIVRGKRVTLSEQEWLDRAAQVTAADSYLAEARETLEEAKRLKGRPGPDRQHPDGETGATDELEAPAPDGETQHPESSFRDVVQKIQYGDPDDAAADLQRLVKTEATKIATEGELQRAYNQDLARSQKALQAFSNANPDLANDENAVSLIERGMYRLYKEDILALGITEDQLPKTTGELANWHRFYRMNGYEVRQTKELLETSKERVLKWRGNGQSETETSKPSRKPAPSVQVNVRRDERRMAIPNQPTRAAVPRRDAQTPANPSRSDIVANMRRARGQL